MNKTTCTSIWRLAGPGALICYALLAPLSALCSTLFALSLQPVVDTGLSGDLARFGLACLAAFLLGAVDLALNHWTVCRQAALVHRCANRLCQHYLHQTLAQKVERLQGQDSAVYLSKLTADAPLISSGYLGNALDLYRSAWSLAASLAVLAAAGWNWQLWRCSAPWSPWLCPNSSSKALTGPRQCIWTPTAPIWPRPRRY